MRLKLEVSAEYTVEDLLGEGSKELLGLEEGYLARELRTLVGWDAKLSFKLDEVKPSEQV